MYLSKPSAAYKKKLQLRRTKMPYKKAASVEPPPLLHLSPNSDGALELYW